MPALRVLQPWGFDAVDVAAERMRRSFALFVRRAWEHIDPAPLVWGSHLDGLCACLQAVTEGRLRQLLINIPPGHAKSMVVSVLWPAWVWTRAPNWSAIFASYEMGLVNRDAVKSRTLTETEFYRRHFRTGSRAWEYLDDQNLKKYFKNSSGGERIGTSVGSGTGYRADALVVDDPLSADQARSDTERKNATTWFFETMSSRFKSQENAVRVVIMQRLHEGDLSGEILSRPGFGGFERLILPSECDATRRARVRALDGSIVWEDKRDQGALLFPEKFGPGVLAQAKLDLGSYAYSGQHEQKPSPAEGGILKRAWFNRRWLAAGERALPGFEGRPLPSVWDRLEIYTDAAFKKTDTSDRVAVHVVGVKAPDLYLLDTVWDRMSFTETLAAIRGLVAKWKPHAICVEDKANGSAIIEILKQEMPGVVEIEPEGGKEARIYAASPRIESGNVWLPQSAVWVGPLVEEACAFPAGRNDDGIDALAYAINRLLTNSELGFLIQMSGGSRA